MRPTLFLCLAGIGTVASSSTAVAQTSGRTRQAQSDLTLTALLSAPFGSKSVSGTATLTGTTIRISWNGDEPGAQRTWSIRRGACNRDEGPVGRGSDSPVVVDQSGGASGSVTLDAPLSTDKPTYVAIRRAPVDTTQPPISCGSVWNGSSHSPGTERANAAEKLSAIDHSSMDHSTMNHASSPSVKSADSTTNRVQMTEDSLTTAMMAIHMRMMADPVIRERVQTDPVLLRMMEQLPAMDTIAGMVMPTAPGTTTGAAVGSSVAKKTTSKASATKTPVKTPPKPATKPAPKPAQTMPGMDHSKMPGMRKPPETRKPPA